MVCGLKVDHPSYASRGAVWDIFTVLGHSDWYRVCEKSNAVVLANTRKRTKIISWKQARWPIAQPTTQVPPTAQFARSGASSFLFWARVLVEHCNTVVVTHMGNCQPVSAKA